MSAPPATLVFSAELLASTGDTGPVEFFVGTNSAGVVDPGGTFNATMPPASVTVSNLLEGEYKLTVRYLGANGTLCPCKLITNTVRVIQLGVRLPSVTPDGGLQFEVVAAFPGKPTVIEASPNLVDWVPISTNQPSNNRVLVTTSIAVAQAAEVDHQRDVPSRKSQKRSRRNYFNPVARSCSHRISTL